MTGTRAPSGCPLKALLILAALLLPLLSYALPFRDGEKLTFDIKYGPISAGSATMEARSSSYQSQPVWLLKTTARSYPFFDAVFKVRDTIESWWDKNTLLPHKFSKQMQEGSYRQHRIHIYDQKGLTTTYSKWVYKDAEWKTEGMTLPFASQDILSAFYEVRNRDLKPGDRLKVNITADGKSVSTEIVVHRRETVASIFGRISCLVVEPKLKGVGIFKQSGRILIWLSDDAYRIPVKMESSVTIGSFVARLDAAENVPYKVKYPS
jgi:hypothetical protein